MSALFTITCPGCKRTLRVPQEYATRAVKCRFCAVVIKPTTTTAISAIEPPPEPAAPLVQLKKPVRPSQKSTSGATKLAKTVVALAVCAAVAYGAFAGGIYLRDNVFNQPGSTAAKEPGNVDSVDPDGVPSSDRLHGPMPRRLLSIGVHQYLYANPVSPGGPNRDLATLTQKLAKALGMPDGQWQILSDASGSFTASPLVSGTPKAAKGNQKQKKKNQPVVEKKSPAPAPLLAEILPTKAVIQQSIQNYLSGSRAQDRIVLCYVGHVAQIDDAAYLVPLEGSLELSETLIPYSWLMDQLKGCKARQKVLILDICRLDPGQGESMIGGSAMSTKLEQILRKTPDGVELWCSAGPDQNSYENGGYCVFLSQLQDALADKEFKIESKPSSSIPIKAIAEYVAPKVKSQAEKLLAKSQLPWLSGEEAKEGSPYDPKEPLSPMIAITDAAQKDETKATAAEASAIFAEVRIPRVPVPMHAEPALAMARLMPFSARDLAEYRSDGAGESENKDREKHPLRAAVMETVATLRRIDSISYRSELSENVTEALKKQVEVEQQGPAKLLGELNVHLELLRSLAKDKVQEPSKRWRANFDYVLAQTMCQIVSLSEYSLMMGKVRREELPTTSPERPLRKIASRTTIQGNKEFKDLLTESRKLLAKIVKDYPRTPWEVLAKREMARYPGLEWQAGSTADGPR